MCFGIMLGILSGPGILLSARFLRQVLYVFMSKYSCRGTYGFPRLSITNPSKSCHGYCLTPWVQCGACSGLW